jgi:hypothetical protein
MGVGTMENAFANAEAKVKRALPLYEVKAMIDVLSMWLQPVPDLTELTHRVPPLETLYACLTAQGAGEFDNFDPRLTSCSSIGTPGNETPAPSQYWQYDRNTGTIKNPYVAGLSTGGVCLGVVSDSFQSDWVRNNFAVNILPCKGDSDSGRRLQQWTYDPMSFKLMSAGGTVLERYFDARFEIDPALNAAPATLLWTSPPNDLESQLWSNEAAPVSNTLNPGESLYKGQFRISRNNRYELVLQEDGNLVFYDKVYDTSGTERAVALWASNTDGKAVSRVTMQTDGNLVLYSPPQQKCLPRQPCTDPALPVEAPLWASGTGGNPGARLVIEDEGNAKIYQDSNTIWANGYRIMYIREPHSAAFVSQSTPSPMMAAKRYIVSITMRNTGPQTWFPGSGLSLASQSPTDNLVWGLRRVNLPAAPGQGRNVQV